MSQSGQEGNSGTTDGAQGGDGNNTGTTRTENQAGTDGTQSGADGAQQNSGDSGEQDTVTRADFERLKNQLSAADKRREQLEQENKDLKAKDLSELEKAKADLEENVKKVNELTAENNRLRLNNAFLSANTITWQNGEVALDIAQAKGYLEDVQDDKGEVDSKKLVAALKKLSEDHKYLVKTEEGGDGDKGGAGSGPSGQAGMGRNSGNANDQKAREDQLKKTFPALGRR